jgi:hypothetical protein
MKIRIFVILLGIMTTMPLFADRGERGAWDEINKNSSSVPSWFIALFIIVGYITYNIFNDKEKDTPNGCIATIIAYILLFILIYIINH